MAIFLCLKTGGIELEVKINREIRNYTENLFFGLSMRPVYLFRFNLRRSRGPLFRTAGRAGHRDGFLALYAGRGSVCRAGICPLSRDDCGKADLDVGEIRVPAPQTALVPAGQPLV